MRHSLPKAPQFYVTAPQPCPYLDGRVERKLFTALFGDDATALNDTLSKQGFRRSQNVLYRPTCSHCSACMSARVRVNDFSPSRSQKRVLSKNKTIIREVRTPWATEEHFDLFQSYLESRHADGGMAGMDAFEFAAMIEETPVQSRIVEYYQDHSEGQKLVAACLTDVLDDGLSMVYSFFDPEFHKLSMGKFIILDHIQMAKEASLPYVYLGFWVPGSSKMDYKSKFKPLEIYKNSAWESLDNLTEINDKPHPLQEDPVSEQVAAIHLPDINDGY